MRRRRRWWVAGAVVLLLVTAGVVTWTRLRDGVAAGTLVEVFGLGAGAATMTGGTVMVPTGRLDVTVGEPTRGLPEGVRPIDSRVRGDLDQVENFGRWIGVSWKLTGVVDDDRFSWDAKDRRQVEVVLLVDGTRHDLRAGESKRSSAAVVTAKTIYLAVAGDPKDLTLEVSYDGLTQTLDPRTGDRDEGVALPLYRPFPVWNAPATQCTPRPAGPDAGGIQLRAPGFEFSDPVDGLVRCTLRPLVGSPYAPGAGWAAPGRGWLTVALITQRPFGRPLVYWPSFRAEPHATYPLRLSTSTVTLAGAKPVTTRPIYSQSDEVLRQRSTIAAYYVFAVSPLTPQPLVVKQVWTGAAGPTDRPDAPPKATATAEATIVLTPER